MYEYNISCYIYINMHKYKPHYINLHRKHYQTRLYLNV